MYGIPGKPGRLDEGFLLSFLLAIAYCTSILNVILAFSVC